MTACFRDYGTTTDGKAVCLAGFENGTLAALNPGR